MFSGDKWGRKESEASHSRHVQKKKKKEKKKKENRKRKKKNKKRSCNYRCYSSNLLESGGQRRDRSEMSAPRRKIGDILKPQRLSSQWGRIG